MQIIGGLAALAGLVLFGAAAGGMITPGFVKQKGRAAVLAKFMIPSILLLGLAGAVAPQEDHGKPEKAVEQDSGITAEAKENKTGRDNPDFIPFEYLNVKTKREVKASVHALVKWQAGRPPSRKQLLATAKHIVTLHPARNNFVEFYLPGAYPDTPGPYAIFSDAEDEDPDLNVFRKRLPDKDAPGDLKREEMALRESLHRREGQSDKALAFSYLTIDKTGNTDLSVDAMVQWPDGEKPSRGQLMATAEYISRPHFVRDVRIDFYAPGAYPDDPGAFAVYSVAGEETDLVVRERRIPDSPRY